METTGMEATDFKSAVIPLYGIRWAAVFAGLAVGLGIHSLLMLIGISAGFAVFGTGARPDGGSMSMATVLWITISMFIAALIGGYVAARASGLRRTADGILHGVVAWGAAMLYFVVLGSVTGTALSSMFGMAAASGVSSRGADAAQMGHRPASLERGDREGVASTLSRSISLSQEQSGRALATAGPPGIINPDLGADLSSEARQASAASTWLSVVILLSLVGGGWGGLIGARGARKRALPGPYGEQRLVRSQATQENGMPKND